MPSERFHARGHFAFLGVLMRLHRGPDGEEYTTRQQAAELKGVSVATIDRWVRVGYLAPVPGCPPRMRLFKLSAVDEAERRAYLAALRTSGSGQRVQRNLAA
jgi:hypothetical protein